ncbi:MAG: HAD family hydrolase [Flavobacteriales bacterium]|nr:HAD family hydrolase [Flavobacteriales bacterium]
MKRLLVFDIDDTLTKSEFQHQTAFVESMKKFGINEINTNWRSYQHYTDSHILKVNYENNLPQEFTFDFIEAFEEEMLQQMEQLRPTVEIPGAVQMLDFITNETDYAVCFATGSILQPAYLKLKQAGFNFNKQLVVGSNGIFERENIVKQAIEQARQVYGQNEFEEIISFGDGIWDLRTAGNIGVHFVGIGDKNLADFEAEGIKHHLTDWKRFDLVDMEKALKIS